MLRTLHVSLKTTDSLRTQFSYQDMALAEWLGDTPEQLKTYLSMMQRIFYDIGSYSQQAKRDIVAGHMRKTKDVTLMGELMLFDRARDQVPQGPEYSYRHLVNAIRRKCELSKQQELDEQRQRTRKAELEQLKNDAKGNNNPTGNRADGITN